MSDRVETRRGAVRRRAAFFVPGYDPRRPSVYHALFTHELGLAARLHGYTAQSGPLEEAETPLPRIALSATGPDGEGGSWETRTTLTLLRWDDVIRPAFREPLPARLPKLLAVGFALARRGVLRRLARIDREFAAFIAYPYLTTLLLLAAIAAGGIAAGWLAAGVSSVAALPAGLLAAGALAWGATKLERPLYLRYLLEDWLFSFAHERGESDALVARTEIFAEAIVAAARDPEIDEVLVVGHSSGAFLAPEALARALGRDPDLGRRGPTVSLLTVGTVAPLMLVDATSRVYRDAVERLAEETGITWHEIQTGHDVMNASRVDPARLSGRFAGPTRWPKVMKLSMSLVVEPGRLGLFRERLFFFRTHFRWLRANDRVAWYDFYGALVGPLRLAERHADVPDLRETLDPARAGGG